MGALRATVVATVARRWRSVIQLRPPSGDGGYIAAITIVVLLISFSGCNRDVKRTAPSQSRNDVASTDVPANSTDSHKRMLQRLLEIQAESATEDFYFEDASIRNTESKLAAMPLSGISEERFTLNRTVGKGKLRLGQTEDAIDSLLAALGYAKKLGGVLSDEQHDRILLDLAVAYLRLAETQNCVECQTCESCILPIVEAGVHAERTGSQEAIKYLTQLLVRKPDDLTARWLLNIAYMTLGEYPDKVPAEFLVDEKSFTSSENFPILVDVADAAGLKVLSCSGGAICDDFDGDHDLDVMVSSWSPHGQLQYFRNNADGTFTEQTIESNLSGLFGGLNMVQADYDNDGDTDVLVLRGAWLGKFGQQPNSLLQNDGNGRFRDVAYEVGLAGVDRPTQTAAWADYDNDGDLDLYVGNETFDGESFLCQLFENRDGKFVDVAAKAGVENDRFSKAVMWGDYDNDRYPDIFVSNYGGENRLYRNNGDGTFTDEAKNAGVSEPVDSFPAWFWDFNNDGALDIYASSYVAGVRYIAADVLNQNVESKPDAHFEGDGKGGFRDVASELGVKQITQPMGSNFGDINNDGWLDYYLGTGYVPYEGLMPNQLFVNRDGSAFSDMTFASRMGHLQKGHGISFADLDHDGDQDVFAEMGGAYPGDAFSNVLFENPGMGNNWITIKLEGRESNRSAIGTRIHVEVDENGTRRSIFRWVNSGGSFGANPLRQQIGIGKATSIDSMEVYWPKTDEIQRFENVDVNQFLLITEGEAELKRLECKAFSFASESE